MKNFIYLPDPLRHAPFFPALAAAGALAAALALTSGCERNAGASAGKSAAEQAKCCPHDHPAGGQKPHTPGETHAHPHP